MSTCCLSIGRFLCFPFGREQAVSEERATQLRDKEQQHAADIREIEVNILVLKKINIQRNQK